MNDRVGPLGIRCNKPTELSPPHLRLPWEKINSYLFQIFLPIMFVETVQMSVSDFLVHRPAERRGFANLFLTLFVPGK